MRNSHLSILSGEVNCVFGVEQVPMVSLWDRPSRNVLERRTFDGEKGAHNQELLSSSDILLLSSEEADNEGLIGVVSVWDFRLRD